MKLSFPKKEVRTVEAADLKLYKTKMQFIEEWGLTGKHDKMEIYVKGDMGLRLKAFSSVKVLVIHSREEIELMLKMGFFDEIKTPMFIAEAVANGDSGQ